MDIIPEITAGQILTTAVTVGGGIVAAVVGYIVLKIEFRGVKKKVEDLEKAAVDFVRHSDLNELREDVRLAVATMGDVRDAVIVLTAKTNATTPVPPARRRIAKAGD